MKHLGIATLTALSSILVFASVALMLSWVGINWITGCGVIDPITRQADLGACVFHPKAPTWGE